MDQGVSVSFEEYYPTLKAWFEHTVYPSTDRITFCARDVTEHKRVEEALRERERFIRQVTELTPVLINVFDLMTERDTYISPDVINVVGYTPDEITQMNDPFALWHPEDVPQAKEHLARSKWAADGEINEFEYRICRHDGEWRWLATRSMPFARSEHGEVRQIVTATIDISEQKRSAEALRASEDRLRMLVESAEEYAIITLDTEGRVTSWSSGAAGMFGYAEAEIIGRSGEILFTPEDRERGVPLEEIKQAREERRVLDERYYFRKDRTRFFGSGVTAVLRDHNGHGYVKITRDLTIRKQAEEALHRAHEELEERVVARTREMTALNEKLTNEITDRTRAQEDLQRSEAYLAEGQKLSHTGSGAWNVSTGEAFWSDETYRIYGFEPGSVKPSYEVFFQLVHLEERVSLQEAFQRAVRKRSNYDLNFRIVRPDGAIRYIHSVGHPIFNQSGDLTELVGTVMDITDRKEAEEKLVASESRFRLLLESIPHHVWSFRIDGTLGYGNQRLIDYAGVTTEERQQGGWAALHPDDVERVRAAWREAWSKGAPYEQEQRVRGRDGRYRRFLCRGVPVPDERGQVSEWFGTDTDIEDLRQAEEALRAVQAELAHMARVTTMGELAASIAHEVNQPLTAVITNGNACVRWLSRDTPNLEEAQQASVRIVKEAHRASEVINRIRNFLKRSPPEKVRLDINDLIRDAIALVGGEIVKNQVLLQTDLRDDLPTISGDRIQLQQVILNLVMNAIEASRAKGDEPRLILIYSQKQPLDQIVVAVRDSGVGIDAANVDQLFKPFITTKAGGMGMGLSISRSIIEAHGGRLWAIPNEGAGATFQFSLPTHTAA
jgi:PAS domain S-box-containing protein